MSEETNVFRYNGNVKVNLNKFKEAITAKPADVNVLTPLRLNVDEVGSIVVLYDFRTGKIYDSNGILIKDDALTQNVWDALKQDAHTPVNDPEKLLNLVLNIKNNIKEEIIHE